MTEAPPDRARGNSPIRSPLDFAGGLFLVGIAAVGYIGAFSLPFGQLSGIGSGLMPKVVAVLVGAFGALLLISSVILDGDQLEKWAVRGPLLVIASVVVFAVLATIACGFLFKEMLSLPIPFDPLNILWPVHGPYEAVKAAIKALVLG